MGPEQLLYGSDRPVVDPGAHGLLDALDWQPILAGTRRVLATPSGVLA